MNIKRNRKNKIWRYNRKKLIMIIKKNVDLVLIVWKRKKILKFKFNYYRNKLVTCDIKFSLG